MRRLHEWKIMNQGSGSISSTGSTSASVSSTVNNKSYKNRFTKLLNYAKAHKPISAERVEIKKIDNHFFHYMVHYKNNSSEWETDLLVAVSRFTDDWTCQFHRDGELISSKRGSGYENLLQALQFYIDIPSIGTSDYKNLLVEWVEIKNNSNTSSNNKTLGNKLYLWETFVEAVIDYLESQPALSDLKVKHYGEGSIGIWQTLHIYDGLPDGDDIRIRFNTETENFEIFTKYDNFKKIKSSGFNFLMSTLNDNAFTIFELGGFDFLGLRESKSTIDDFKDYDILWD